MNIQSRIINIFRRHPHCFIGIISSSYPLSQEQITKYQEKLLWTYSGYGFYTAGMSSNETIKWSFELLDKLIKQWDWRAISTYIIGEYLWSDDILEKYYDQVNWRSLCWNRSIPWTEELLEKYEDKLDWEWLSSNTGIPWTKELIEKYEDKINWSDFSNNSRSPISEYHQFDYKRERSPSKMPPDDIIDFIEKYEDRLDWNCLFWDWKKGLNRIQTDRIIDNVMKSIPILKWPEDESPF